MPVLFGRICSVSFLYNVPSQNHDQYMDDFQIDHAIPNVFLIFVGCQRAPFEDQHLILNIPSS